MTNEEWAIEIQAGWEDCTALWEQVHRFIRQQAHRYFTLHAGTCTHAGVELDDLLQCGFMALQDAVRAYRPESGYSLLAYIKYPLLKHFREASTTALVWTSRLEMKERLHLGICSPARAPHRIWKRYSSEST